jgi:hypothetical protein
MKLAGGANPQMVAGQDAYHLQECNGVMSREKDVKILAHLIGVGYVGLSE